jgi:phosphoribosylformylglycinamidine synthase subunit PurQ / glutaminase
MRIGVVQFPGSCDERDAAHAVRVVGGEPVLLWHGEADLQGVDAVIVPGGFSYGDYLRAGAIARFSPVMGAVVDYADRGGPVLGICNGFQVLCEAGLLPGALTRNVNLRFVHRDQHLRVEGASPWCTALPGTVLRVPVKNGEGRYVHPDPESLWAAGQVLVRYCDADGEVTEAANPNGSVANIAGVTNAAGNVAGLMPHPEHAVDPLLGSTDGRALFGAALDRVATA